jgi:hypothetical protein
MMLVAVADFHAEVDGEIVMFEKGKDRVRAGHEPAGTRHLFEVATTGPGLTQRSEIRATDAGGRLLDDQRRQTT